MKRNASVASILFLALIWPQASRGASKDASSLTQQRVASEYGHLPLTFETNHGQTDPGVRFLARGPGYTLFLMPGDAVLWLRKSSQKSNGGNLGTGIRAEGPMLSTERRSGDRFGALSLFPAIRGTDLRNAQLQENPGFALSGAPDRQRLANQEQSTTDAVLQMKLVGANPNAKITGLDELPGKSNYFIGNDPKKWRTNVPNYAKVRYKNIYPGVDLVYYGNQQQLEYDFVAPGADPSAIALSLSAGTSAFLMASVGRRQGNITTESEGGAGVRLDSAGDLVVRTDSGEIRFHKPVIYQLSGVGKDYVDGRYVLEQVERQNEILKSKISFEVAAYDKAKPLVIDPVLSYSTFLGGSGDDFGNRIAVNLSGNAYVTGSTTSTAFPTTLGALPTTLGAGDAFVSKLNASGSALIYSTYLAARGGKGLSHNNQMRQFREP